MPKRIGSKTTAGRETAQQKTMRVAFCGVMAALSVVVMLLGGLMPMFTYISPLAAALVLAVVLLEYGSTWAWLTWLATVLVSLMLGTDKEAAIFYLFFGYYPILKPVLDSRIPGKNLCLAAKAAYFTLASGLMFLFLMLFFPVLAAEFKEMGLALSLVLILLMDLCLLVYDYGLPGNLRIYERRIRPHMRFIHR